MARPQFRSARRRSRLVISNMSTPAVSCERAPFLLYNANNLLEVNFMEERFFEHLPFFILGTLLFIGYVLEKMYKLLIEWKVDWDSINNPIETDEDNIA
jgi:hypothetical protein